MAEEPKNATKNKKRERASILPPFTISIEELYSILEAWSKDGVVILPKCKGEPMKEEKRGPLHFDTIGGVTTIQWIFMP